jgi:uncharacterized protein (TIGR03437 family)
MRLLPAVLLTVVISRSAPGQNYTISTFAGGALPANNIPGKSAVLAYAAPQGIATDKAGNVFFSDEHTILRLDAATGVLTRLAGNGTPGFSGDNGPATSAQLNDPWGVAVDSAGNLYIADSSNFRIRKVSNGVITTVAGTGGWTETSTLGDNGPATSAWLYGPQGVAVDSAGNVYIADTYNNRIRKVSNGVITTVAGNGFTNLYGDNGPATDAQLWVPCGVAVDASGDFYIADTGHNLVRKVSKGVITSVAQGLNNPLGVAVDSAGNLFIADTFNHAVRKVSNGTMTTVAGNGTPGFRGDDGPAASAQLNYPNGVAVDSAGNVYIADTYNSSVRKVSKGVITSVVGNGPGFAGDNGPATGARLAQPYGLAVDSAGSLYVAERGTNCVRKVSNGVITTVAGNGTSGYSGDNGPATSAQMYFPRAVAVDSAGSLYIAEYGDRIRKVSNGVITTVAGNGTRGFSGDDGPATSAQLDQPWAVAVDSAGNLFIADTGNNRIRKVSNGVITTVAGNGTGGYAGDNGPAISAQLYIPQGLAVDSADDLYIADTGNSCIRKVSSGVITLVTCVESFPNGVAVDSAGSLYIAARDGNVIHKVPTVGPSIVAGNGTPGFSGDNGPAASAQLNQPNAVAVDSAGNVYVADTGNNRIRVLTPPTPLCTYSVLPATLQAPAGGGNLVVNVQTTASCSWTVSGLPSWITVSPGATSRTGASPITLTVVANAGAARTATLSIAGVSVQVTQGSIPLPSINPDGVVNAASSAARSPVAPGSIATGYGSFLISSLATAPNSPLPTNLAGLSMQFDSGLRAPLFAVSGGQVNFQVPWELAGQSQTALSVTVNGQTGAAQAVNLAPFSPGIFSMNAQGTGQGAVLDSSYRLVDSSNPATGSTVIQIYCTGLGPVTNQPASGSSALGDPLSRTTTTPTVMIGGAQADVLFSGLAPGSVGEYQVNVLVPAGSSKGAAVSVVIAIGGATSNTVTIAVQ